MIRPRALLATLGFSLLPLGARACPQESFACIPRLHFAVGQDTVAGLATARSSGARSTALGVGVGLDFFPIDELSVGLRAGVSADDSFGSWAASYEAKARVGYNLAFAKRWSFWPRAVLGLENLANHLGSGPNDVVVHYASFTVGMVAPILFHPNRHFFVGLGPEFTVPVATHADGITNPFVASRFGLGLSLGGHF